MQLGNWIRQTTTTTGTGALTLASVSGWATFDSQFSTGADGAGDYFYYTILNDSDGSPIEAGIGRMSDSTTLQRVHVLATFSSGVYAEANSAVNLAAGTKRVICADLAGVRPVNLPGMLASATDKFLLNQIIQTGAGNSVSLNASTIYLAPFLVQTPARVTGMGTKCVTLAASSTLRLGLYRVKSDLSPGNLIDSTGDMDTSTTGIKSSAFSGGTRRLKPGLYYAAFKSFGGNPSVFAAEATPRVFQHNLLGGDPSTGDSNGLRLYADGSSAAQALPTTPPTLTFRSGVSAFTPMCYLVLETL